MDTIRMLMYIELVVAEYMRDAGLTEFFFVDGQLFCSQHSCCPENARQVQYSNALLST
jgi:hypothetical protein